MQIINISLNEKTKAGKAVLTVVEALNGHEGVVAKLYKPYSARTRGKKCNSEFVKEILQRYNYRRKYCNGLYNSCNGPL